MLAFKRLISVGLLAVTLSGSVAYADPNNTQRSTQQKINSLEEEIQVMDNEIEGLMIELEELHKRKSENKSNLERITKELGQADKDKEVQEVAFAKRAAALYKAGYYEGQSITGKILFYLQGLTVKTDNIMDVLENVHNTKVLIEHDNTLLMDLKDTQEKIVSNKKEIELIGKTIEEQEKDYAQKQKAVEQKKTNLLTKLSTEKEALAQEQEQARIQAMASRPTVSSRSGTISSPSPDQLAGLTFSGNSSSVVQESFKYLGIPYVWGGTTTRGFDCSGYMQYIFRQHGVNLPRVSQEQQKVGKTIALSEKQPGDLVFFGNPATHVGLYIGNNQYIHSPQTGDVVKISPLTRPVSTVKRVM